MKKLTLLLVFSIVSIGLISQTLQAFKYQAVVRDNLGAIVANQEVSFRFSIRDEIAIGDILYQEVHLESTDAYGRANLEIGRGAETIGVFEDIDWGDDERYLEVELDLEGGSVFVSMGTTQLLAVPYALYAESTGDTSRWKKADNDLYYNNGNIGVGTNSPQYNLDIYGNATGQSRLRLTNPDNSKILLFGSGNDSYNSSITFHDGDALRFMRYDGGYSELMRIQSNGNLGIGTGNPDESALLEVNSNSKGFLSPRMTQAQREVINDPAEGLLVYQTDTPVGFYFFKNGVWTRLSQTTTSTAQVATPVVTIGCQSWMTTNLDVDRYRNGDPIPQVTDPTAWAALTTGAYCYYNNDSATYAAVYGKLYNWYAVNDPRGLAPEGWHVPTHFEWITLTDCLGGLSVAGGPMKETGITHWNPPNTEATNFSGFTGLPGGFCGSFGYFGFIGSYGYWWSSTEDSSDDARYRGIYYESGNVSESMVSKQSGFSVRCLRD